MSYIRAGHDLHWFKGVSTEYVFDAVDGGVEDYDSEYNDNASFCELIGLIVLKLSRDKQYADKIVRVLAKKLGIEHELRKKVK